MHDVLFKGGVFAPLKTDNGNHLEPDRLGASLVKVLAVADKTEGTTSEKFTRMTDFECD